jgi:hypothetical protein
MNALKRSPLLVLFFLVCSLVLTACGPSLKEELAYKCLIAGGKKGPACDYFFALEERDAIQRELDLANENVDNKEAAYKAAEKAEEKAVKAETATAQALTATAEALLQPTPTATPTYLPPVVVPGSTLTPIPTP